MNEDESLIVLGVGNGSKLKRLAEVWELLRFDWLGCELLRFELLDLSC